MFNHKGKKEQYHESERGYIMKIARIILFFMMLSMPAMAAERMSSAWDRGAIDVAELRFQLNSFATRAEGHIEMVLQGLKVISVAEEAQSGEWEKMKKALAEFGASGIKASAVWFVRPDGSYYIVGRGLSSENLSDRPYFPRLMAGADVIGDLVISKSTGMRTAIVIVPIKKNGKIIGALGASLDLEQMSRMLDENIRLPENMFFYALDQKGQTSLHKVSALIFGYPSDMGSKSLTKTVQEMLAGPEGLLTYDFYGERTVIYKKFPLTGWIYVIGIATGKPGHGAEIPPILNELAKEVTAELNKVDQDVADLAGRLSEKDFTTAEKRKMLSDLCRTYSYTVDCAFVDGKGKMAIIWPQKYAEFEGSDISGQEHLIRLQKTMKPVLSMTFKTVQGFDAVALHHPIFSRKGEFSGSVSVLFKPESLLSDVIAPVLRGLPVETFVMQTDGRILYDQDTEDTGRMLFEDPIYKPFPQLLAVAAMSAKEKTGAGSYDFGQHGSGKIIKKDAHWTTVGLHGTEWRLIVMHMRTGQPVSSREEITIPGADSDADALRKLAENAGMKKAISGNDEAKVREIFRDFYSEHPRIYSIQWLDGLGINRYGYPEENSLINFDIKTSKKPSAKPVLQALSGKKESSFDSPLVEGKTGSFLMVPIYEEGEYLGMIYTIRIKE